MHAITRERSRSESGFTLIELLVVMIIIAILMAVAIPTFLSQKNSALKTQATSNIKQVVNALESCAAQIPTGGYKEQSPGTFSCEDTATLIGFEKSLTSLGLQNTAPTAQAQYQIDLSADDQGYLVQTMIKDSGTNVFFAEIHASDGGLYKVCDTVAYTAPPAGTTAYTPPAPNTAGLAKTKSCKTGKWG